MSSVLIDVVLPSEVTTLPPVPMEESWSHTPASQLTSAKERELAELTAELYQGTTAITPVLDLALALALACK